MCYSYLSHPLASLEALGTTEIVVELERETRARLCFR